MKRSVMMLMALLFAATPAAMAQQQSTEDAGQPFIVHRTDATDSTIFARNRLKRPKPADVPVPKFTMRTRDRKFMMTIGGQIAVLGGYDLKNDLSETDAGTSFVTQDIPVPSTRGHRSSLFAGVPNTYLTFQVVGFGGTENEVSGFIKLKSNSSLDVYLDEAYASWRGFTIGYVTTLLEDGNACQPPTIDPQGPSGEVTTSVYELNYVSNNYSGFQFALGLDLPTYYASNGVYRGHDYKEYDGKEMIGTLNQVVPDIPLWIQYTDPNNAMNRIRLSGILRSFRYRDLHDAKDRFAMGWGAQLSGNLNLWSPLTFYANLLYGRGIGNYIQDIQGLPLSFIPADDKPGKVEAAPMMGITLGFSYNITSKWQFNIMGSEARIWDVRDYASTGDYKYGLYFATNVFYQMNNWMQFGLEYLWGRKQTWDNGSAHDNRVQAQVLFTI